MTSRGVYSAVRGCIAAFWITRILCLRRHSQLDFLNLLREGHVSVTHDIHKLNGLDYDFMLVFAPLVPNEYFIIYISLTRARSD